MFRKFTSKRKIREGIRRYVQVEYRIEDREAAYTSLLRRANIK